MSRSVLYTSSPLLASKTPVWRSKFIVAMIGLGFVGLGADVAAVTVVPGVLRQQFDGGAGGTGHGGRLHARTGPC